MTSPLDKERPCRSVNCYELLNFIDEGTYGRVFRARDIETDQIYALKELRMTSDKEGFPVTSLREITTLFSVRHENIVSLKEVVVGSKLGTVYLVLEYAEHDLLSLLLRMEKPYSASEIKSLMQQLLRGVCSLHENWIIHRDIKPSNLLLTSQGILKICDFGLARNYSDPLGKYTHGVITLWYRAPELLLGSTTYSTAVDMWGVGCIFAELVLKKPLLQGNGELDQIGKMASMFGGPSENCWRGFSKLPHAQRLSFRSYSKRRFAEQFFEGSGTSRRLCTTKSALDLMEKMLLYDPQQRISAANALKHPYFSESPIPKDPSLIQTFPDDRRGN